MIYLIQSAGYKVGENNSISYFQLLKIGYTEDNRKDVRFTEYKMHNPTCKVLYEIIGGTEEQEKKLHYKFKDLLYEDYGREWFKYSDDIVKFFSSIKSLDDINKLSVPESYIFKNIKNKYKSMLSYFVNYEDIDNYINKLIINLGSNNISEESIIEYIKNDLSIDQNKVNKYLEIIKAKETGIYCEDEEINEEVLNFIKIFNTCGSRYEKLKVLCEYNLSQKSLKIILSQFSDNDEVKFYYSSLGPERLYSLGYNISRIRKELDVINFSEKSLAESVYSVFHEGEKLSLVDIKSKLSNIYVSINYKSIPKATDILKWFDVKGCLIYNTIDNNKKRVRAYELLRSKRDILDEKYSE